MRAEGGGAAVIGSRLGERLGRTACEGKVIASSQQILPHSQTHRPQRSTNSVVRKTFLWLGVAGLFLLTRYAGQVNVGQLW